MTPTSSGQPQATEPAHRAPGKKRPKPVYSPMTINNELMAFQKHIVKDLFGFYSREPTRNEVMEHTIRQLQQRIYITQQMLTEYILLVDNTNQFTQEEIAGFL